MELMATARLSLVCDQCQKLCTIEVTETDSNVYGVIDTARKKVRQQSLMDGWLWRSYGNKGIKHYCPNCAQTPELAAWKMEKILAGKWKKTAFVS
jgi:hypothetical protein